MLKKFLDSCNSPLIFTGDLNSVPSSWVYKRVKDSGLKDAFQDNGFGFGRTYHSIQPALRIDYIFYNHFIKASATHFFKPVFPTTTRLLWIFPFLKLLWFVPFPGVQRFI
jgi:endonuclease/exonuclease/phosphatase family metal-dependent hydrolase